jgi:uncharacterized protein YbjT (DUF2867 family)
MRKSLTLLGSTGLVGSELLQLCLNSSKIERIHAINRKSLMLKHNKLEEILCPNNEYSEVSSFFATSTLVCCLGTTIKQAKTQEQFRAIDYELPLKAARIFQEQGGEHFILLSAVGANAQSRVFYNRVKGELENELKKMAFDKLTIVRPSLLIGKRSEARPLEQFAQKISPLTNLFMLGPLRKYRAVAATHVASELLAHALNQNIHFQIEYQTQLN